MKVDDILQEFSSYHENIENSIKELVAENGNKIECKGTVNYYVPCGDRVWWQIYKQITIDERGVCSVTVASGEGWEYDLDGDTTEIELWEFSADELWNLIIDIKGV